MLIHTRQRLLLTDANITIKKDGVEGKLNVQGEIRLGGRTVGCNYDYVVESASTIFVVIGTRDAEIVIHKWIIDPEDSEKSNTSTVIKTLTPPTSRRIPLLKGVVLSHDCKSLMAVSDDGVIWRFVEREKKENEENEEKKEDEEKDEKKEEKNDEEEKDEKMDESNTEENNETDE